MQLSAAWKQANCGRDGLEYYIKNYLSDIECIRGRGRRRRVEEIPHLLLIEPEQVYYIEISRIILSVIQLFGLGWVAIKYRNHLKFT